MKKIVVSILLILAIDSWAIDVFDSKKGQLTIPNVLVGTAAYNNVVVNINSVLSVGSAPANGVIDFYNSSTAQLTIPSVQVESKTYYNVVATVKNVVSLGSSSEPSSKFNLSSIRSYVYAIADGTWRNDINQIIANSNSDLIILNFGPNAKPLNRSQSDPSGRKLIFGYYDVGEAFSSQNPSLFSNNIPSWFGNPNTGWSGLYTVQYWNPLWLQQIFNNIDLMVAQGYDGIFLDVLSADNEWKLGNQYNNSVNTNALSQLVDLLTSIRSYVNQKYSSKNLLLLGNNPIDIAMNYPKALKNLDGIFNESAYYINFDAYTSTYSPNNANNTLQLSTTYSSANIPIIGNDYPPLDNPSSILQGLDFYNSLGWTPSINLPNQTANIMTSGPNLWMANQTFNTIVGAKNTVNYIVGGQQPNAVLIGGDRGDYFIGGPGQNIIQCGNGNDIVYAHPANSSQQSGLVITYNAINKGSSNPQLSVSVNGVTYLSNYSVTTSVDGSITSTVTVNLPNETTINSLSLVATNIDQTGTGYPNQYSNIQVGKIVYQNQSIPLSSGIWSNNINHPGLFNNKDTAIFTGLSLQPIKFLPNTKDQIDGGGGINTVVYRANRSNYAVIKQTDGSYLVTSAATAEGPDNLTNIQILQFADQTMNLN
jgi:cysteinyl-tRNA synthetase